jgi:FdrA protein
VASNVLGPVASNVPIHPEWTIGSSTSSSEHWVLDLGDDAYTVGRPHPMIDFGPRLSMLEREAADPSCRVLLLDVVLGHGAHPDPAAELAPAIRAALRRETPLTVMVSLVGTQEDPQGLERQAVALRDAGAWVHASNAAAARHAAKIARRGGP